MRKNKNNQAIWGTRIKKSSSTLFQKVGNSIDIDKRLYREDIQGSIAHVEMLFKQKIISFKIKNKIIYGLNKIEKEISNKKFEFNKKYEDLSFKSNLLLNEVEYFRNQLTIREVATGNLGMRSPKLKEQVVIHRLVSKK